MTQKKQFNQSELPNIPGYRVSYDNRDRFHKAHVFDVRNGIPVTDLKRDTNFAPNELENKIISKVQTDSEAQANKENDTAHAGTGALPMGRLPRWVVYDRKVLRFYSYFTENVFNSAIEKVRVRKCVIYYFLEDDTISICEIREENSGIPQSTFLKRQKVPKNGQNDWLTHLDFSGVGTEVNIYNRKFMIVDADESTRKYFKENDNIVLAAAPENAPKYPKDDYIKHAEKREEYTRQSQASDNNIKSYVEAILGRVSSERLAASKKYLANEGKVLRFWGVWNDASLFGTKRYYEIHYFLADDTIEVMEREEKLNKNGKHNRCPALLKRLRLPKQYVAGGGVINTDANSNNNSSSGDSSGDSRGDSSGDSSNRTAPKTDSEIYYTHSDFRIGGYINVYGRQVLLTKADEFTKSFYVSVHGLTESDFEEIAQQKPAEKYLSKSKEVPPYNGFGTEEDSLGSWHSLVPKPPLKNHQKLEKFDGCCLRFLAKLNEKHTCIENYGRRFVIEFYLQDDTILIYERQIRNSGFIGGKFLERKKCKNRKLNDKWFHAEDFFVGADININGFEFILLETDLKTVSIVSKNTQVFTRDDPEVILRSLADKLWDRSSNQTQTFRSVDQDKDRLISPQELKALCLKYNWNVNPNQLNAIFGYFDTDNSGHIEADEFFKALQKFKLENHIHIPSK